MVVVHPVVHIVDTPTSKSYHFIATGSRRGRGAGSTAGASSRDMVNIRESLNRNGVGIGVGISTRGRSRRVRRRRRVVEVDDTDKISVRHRSSTVGAVVINLHPLSNTGRTIGVGALSSEVRSRKRLQADGASRGALYYSRGTESRGVDPWVGVRHSRRGRKRGRRTTLVQIRELLLSR